MDYAKILDLASKISLASLLILILLGGYQGVWIYGSTYREMVADRDEWKHLAMEGAHLATKASALSIRGISLVEPKDLTVSSSKEDVNQVLEVVRNRTHYMSEPSDAPLP
jgi:hypothetical protein